MSLKKHATRQLKKLQTGQDLDTEHQAIMARSVPVPMSGIILELWTIHC